ncbi:TPA: hypothetical protein PMC50_002829 [Vibrio cholerae]|nr:hypothetical protein [Vibrio cholerae]
MWYLFRHHAVNKKTDEIKTLNGRDCIAERVWLDGKLLTRQRYIDTAVALGTPLIYEAEELPEYKEGCKRDPLKHRKFYFTVEHISGTSEKVWNLSEWCREKGLKVGHIHRTADRSKFSKQGYRAIRMAVE